MTHVTDLVLYVAAIAIITVRLRHWASVTEIFSNRSVRPQPGPEQEHIHDQ